MLKPAVNQVAGHQAGAGQIGPLVDGTGRFYKPLQDKERGEKEVQFYKQFWVDNCVPEEGKTFFPHFYGTMCIEIPNESGLCDHAMLEDLTHSFQHPSVMDIKIGVQTWYPGASEKYIQKCLIKDRETTSGAIGFRVSGMQVYEAAIGRTWKPDRNWCKQLTTDRVEFALKRFVSSNPSDDMEPDTAFASAIYGGLNGIIHQLEELKNWFQRQTSYHFYSSSLLLIYEGNHGSFNLGDQGVASPSLWMPLVRMVDFAHVLHGQDSIDENFIDGLKSLISYLTQIVDNFSTIRHA